MSKLVKVSTVLLYVLGSILVILVANNSLETNLDIPSEMMPLINLISIFFGLILTSLFLYIELYILQLIAKAFGVTYKKWLLFTVSVIQVYIGLLGIYSVIFTFISIIVGGILVYYLHKELNEDNKRLLYVTGTITLISLISSIIIEVSTQMIGMY